MRISVVADVHGNDDDLQRVAEQADHLLILGDLLDYIDYHDPRRGIIGEMFGPRAAERFAGLRAVGDFTALRTLNTELWGSVPDAPATLSEIVRARYRRICSFLPDATTVILGNVDVAADWAAVAGDRFPARDGEVIVLDGVRFGFVSGAARRRPGGPVGDSEGAAWRPYVRPRADYEAALGRVGPADVICTHVPPAIAVLRYDVVPARTEMYAPGLVEYIDHHRPQLALFGHVHQPLSPRARRGWTECLNAGHFQRRPTPLELDTERLRAIARRGRRDQ